MSRLIRTPAACATSLRCSLRRLPLACTVLWLALAGSLHTARADAIDLAIDGLTASGGAVGIPISPAEASVVKSLVRNMVDKGESFPDAVKDAVMAPLIGDLPPELQTAARCLAGGTPARQCASDQVISRLPPDVQGAATCLASGADIKTCAKGELSKVVGQLESAAQGAVDSHFQRAPTSIENILNLVAGIEQGDMGMVLANGGAAVAKFVADQIINSVLPPGVLELVGPIVDTIIQNRIDLVTDLVRAAQAGDVAQATQVAVEAYLTMQAEGGCAVLNELPGVPDSFKEAVCGTTAKVIAALGGAVNDLVQYAGGILEHPFRVLNVPDDLVNAIGDGVLDFDEKADGKNSNCQGANQYYASRYAVCYAAGASKKITDPAGFSRFQAQLDDQCHRYYAQCHFSAKWRPVCDGMKLAFDQQEQQINDALTYAANSYARGLAGYVQGRGFDACQAGFLDQGYQDFINQCGSALDKQIPLGPGDISSINPDNDSNHGLTTNCQAPQQSFATDYVSSQACRAAVSPDAFRKAVSDVCRHVIAQPEDAPVKLPTANDVFSAFAKKPLINPVSPFLPPFSTLNTTRVNPGGVKATKFIESATPPQPQPPQPPAPHVIHGTPPRWPTVSHNGSTGNGGDMSKPGGTTPSAPLPPFGVLPKPPAGSSAGLPPSNGGPYPVQPGGTPLPKTGGASTPTAPTGPGGTSKSGGGPDSVYPGGMPVPKGPGGSASIPGNQPIPRFPAGTKTAPFIPSGGISTTYPGGTSVPKGAPGSASIPPSIVVPGNQSILHFPAGVKTVPFKPSGGTSTTYPTVTLVPRSPGAGGSASLPPSVLTMPVNRPIARLPMQGGGVVGLRSSHFTPRVSLRTYTPVRRVSVPAHVVVRHTAARPARRHR